MTAGTKGLSFLIIDAALKGRSSKVMAVVTRQLRHAVHAAGLRPADSRRRLSPHDTLKHNAAEILGGLADYRVFYRGASSSRPCSSFSWHSMQ